MYSESRALGCASLTLALNPREHGSSFLLWEMIIKSLLANSHKYEATVLFHLSFWLLYDNLQDCTDDCHCVCVRLSSNDNHHASTYIRSSKAHKVPFGVKKIWEKIEIFEALNPASLLRETAAAANCWILLVNSHRKMDTPSFTNKRRRACFTLQ